MNENERINKKCIEDIKDRLAGVFNDLKAFVYIRNHNLQHREENIGGGNMVTALSLFACLNFLAKTYYCTIRPDKFNKDGFSINETEAFLHFMKFIQKSGLDLGLPSNGDILELVWSGFRDWLTHRLTVQPGKQIINFTFEPSEQNSIAESLEYAKRHKVFQDDDNDGKNWVVNCDVLLALLPNIIELTTDHIKTMDKIDNNLLLKVIGTKYP
ncbi:hypothetical protein KKI22_03320 [Patescibacteria group bacterium]|nr:hypothetical protein [Patescibacteria group bacterium]